MTEKNPMTSSSDSAESMATAVVTDMRWWDIPQIVALEAELFPGDSPWTEAMFWSELAEGHYYRVYRSEAGDVLGYAGLARFGDSADVQTIGVAPHARRRGIGRMLLEDLLTAAGPMAVLLEVRHDNTAAIDMYRSAGFHKIGLRRNYYRPSGADAWTMRRDQKESK